MRASEFEQLDEGWRDQLANAALAAAVTTGAGAAGIALKDVGKDQSSADKPAVQVAPQQTPKDLSKITVPTIKTTAPKTQYKPLTNSPNELVLAKTAQANGITGVELAAFMAQMAHESENFKDMVEDRPNIKKYATGKTAKILGNRNENDAKRFIGRGYIQLTGRWNYEWMQKQLGIDLTSTWSAAHRASEPEVAAKIAVAFWKNRVRPNVADFTDVSQVTKPINKGMHGLEHRQVRFERLAQNMGIQI